MPLYPYQVALLQVLFISFTMCLVRLGEGGGVMVGEECVSNSFCDSEKLIETIDLQCRTPYMVSRTHTDCKSVTKTQFR